MKQTAEHWKLAKYPETDRWNQSKAWLVNSAKILKKWEDDYEMDEQEFDAALIEAAQHHG